MASRQSMSSILKPPKVRAPLKEIEPVDQDSDENTATSSKRKVSFSGMNKIKMYNTCATSLTVNQAPMFDEKISISSDSLNGDKTKLSGKFEKSDGQITFESTDCTNVEDNGLVIIEYESPSDNMEMTEAKVGELHDSMFLIGNYDSERINSSLDDSETNMEFTEAIQAGRIITVDMESDFSSTELSETLNSEHEGQLCHKPSTQPSSDLPKIISDKSSNSSCMEFTCTSTKVMNSVGIDISNMEFTCMTDKSQKSALNDDYKSFSMELTQVPDRLAYENCSEFIYECSIDETSCEKKNNSHCELVSEQCIFYSEAPVIDNDAMVCTLKNIDNSEKNAVNLSLSLVSMDIDPTIECNGHETNDIVVNNSELPVNKQNCTDRAETPMVMENITHSLNSVLNNSNMIDIKNQNNQSRVSMIPSGSSFVQDISLDLNIDKSLATEKSLKQSFNAHTSMFDPNQYLLKEKSIIVEGNQPRKYSRKTMVHTAPVNVEIDVEKFLDHFDMSIDAEESQLIKSSTVPTSDFNQSLSLENEDLSDKSAVNEENHQKICYRKSVAPTNMANEIQSFYENENLSDKSAIDHNNYSRKSNFDMSVETEESQLNKSSILPTSDFNQSPSYEIEDLSDKSIIDNKNQQQIYSRKSIAPTNMTNEIKSFYEDEDLSDESTVLKENQKNYSRKSIISKSVLNQSQFYEMEDFSNKSIVDEENQQKIGSRKSVAVIFNEIISENSVEIEPDKSTAHEENHQKTCSRKSVAPALSNMAKEINSFYVNEDLLNKSTEHDGNQQKNYLRKSIINQSQSYEIEDLSDKSIIDNENQQKMYSRKSIASTNMTNEIKSFYENEDLSDESTVLKENQKNYSRKSVAVIFNESISENSVEIEQNRCSIESIASISNQSNSLKNENVSNTSVTNDENVHKKYSRKSVGPTSFFKEALEDDISDNLLLNEESNVFHTSSKSDVKQLDVSNYYKENLTQKIQNQSTLHSVISVDDLNSPFRKKSRKSTASSILINEHVKQTSPLNNQENFFQTTGDQSINDGNESEMDISMDYESKTGNVVNISSPKINTSENILHEAEENNVNNENHASIYCENEEKIIVPNELEKNEADFYQLAENHEIINESDEQNKDKTNDTKIINHDKSNQVLNSKDLSFSYGIDRVTNTICVEGISNMSITDEKHDCIEKSEEKAFFGNRKRSYSNRDCIPLSCSSFVSNSNVENCINININKAEILKESPVKVDDVVGDTVNDPVIVNMIEEDLDEKESFKENLNNEVLEFLNRWTQEFSEKKLSLDKCTNKEWIFNILDSNIMLKISYSPISNDVSFLKVENISLITNIISQDEITKFGVNWILSKYNPKVYKQICYTSRDIELLLKCLLEDVHFISKMMKNMTLIRDIHFVTFKDNQAEFVLHKMIPPLMVRFEISLSNIHKLSVKDITVDCFFGSFDKSLLDEALENINKDFKVLQSFIEKLGSLVLKSD